MEGSETKKKRARRSGKHSKTGCGTCKVRRIKCDEGRPICSRCKNFGVTCDGYTTQALPSRPRPLSQAPTLLPKQPTSRRLHPPNITFMTSNENVRASNLLRVTPFENDNEARYYRTWCTSTVYQVLPYCQYSMHSSMLYGACSEPSIRHAFIALAALHEAAITVQQSRSLSFDRLGLVASSHHRKAIEHYSLSIQFMREAIAGGKQDIRTTLVTCFVIFGFEAFHGNLALAVAQIQTGIALMVEWKENYLRSRNPSSAPDDEVIETFLCLEIQIMGFHDKRPYETHAMLRTEYAEKIGNMPRIFTSPWPMWEATKYFYIVKKHLEHFLHVAKRLISLCPGAGDEYSAGREHLLDEARSYQVHHQAELSQWHSAFKVTLASTDTEHDVDNKCRAAYLRLHFIASKLVLETVFATDEMIYDEYTAKFCDMIAVSTVLIELCESRSMTTKWTFDISVVMPLYLIALKCRVGEIRRKAFELLNRNSKREGIWDNVLVGKMAGWVRTIEEEKAVGDNVPGWARVENVQSSFDLQNRSVEMKCRQRSGEGLVFQERSTTIVW